MTTSTPTIGVVTRTYATSYLSAIVLTQTILFIVFLHSAAPLRGSQPSLIVASQALVLAVFIGIQAWYAVRLVRQGATRGLLGDYWQAASRFIVLCTTLVFAFGCL